MWILFYMNTRRGFQIWISVPLKTFLHTLHRKLSEAQDFIFCSMILTSVAYFSIFIIPKREHLLNLRNKSYI